MTLPQLSEHVTLSRAHRFERAQADRYRDSGTEDRTGPDGSQPSPCPDGGVMPSPSPKTAPEPTAARRLELQSRAELRDLLIAAGLARAAAEKVARGGWPALAGEITETDLAEECADLARTLAETFKDF